MANAEGVTIGDAVLYEEELYRVSKVGENDELYLVNVNTKLDFKIVSADDVTRIGRDTLSGIYKPEPKKKNRWRIGDWVKNERLGLIGEVLGTKDNRVKAEVVAAGGELKLYWWDADELTTAIQAYRDRDKKDQSWTNWNTQPTTQRRTSKPPGVGSTTPTKKPKPQTKSLGISTAGLIKGEVKKLEKEQRTRPLKSNAPTKKKDDTFDGPAKPVPKRRGDW